MALPAVRATVCRQLRSISRVPFRNSAAALMTVRWRHYTQEDIDNFKANLEKELMADGSGLDGVKRRTLLRAHPEVLMEPQEDFSRDPEYVMDLLAKSPIGLFGPELVGRTVEAIIIENQPDKVLVDFGMKFPGVLKRKQHKIGRMETTPVGKRVAVKILNLEATAHLLGDSKHTSIYMAEVSFVRSLEKLPSLA